MKPLEYFNQHHAEIAEWRQNLHRRPGLLFDVAETADFVADKLREFGVDEVIENVGQTGVVGILRGAAGTVNHAIGLRADMDALPITEATSLPYQSEIDGKMHACGHDGHTSMLLGAAKYLAQTRNFSGTVVLIFQPAEEGGVGAKAMLDDGLMERFGIGEVYGLHNRPGMPVGTFASRHGELMASGDNFTIEITGKGAHAARPHLGVDPVLVASHIHTALQSIVSRVADPISSLVVSVTQIHGGDAYNVIPQTAKMCGTVRSLDQALRAQAEAQLHSIAQGIASGMGATVEIDYQTIVPVTANTPEFVEIAMAAAANVVGVANTTLDGPLNMGGEDFSFMLQARPGAHIFLGQGDTVGLHHPEYDFNDEIIPYGCAYWATLAEQRGRA